jgi:hypothetical protein
VEDFAFVISSLPLTDLFINNAAGMQRGFVVAGITSSLVAAEGILLQGMMNIEENHRKIGQQFPEQVERAGLEVLPTYKVYPIFILTISAENPIKKSPGGLLLPGQIIIDRKFG